MDEPIARRHAGGAAEAVTSAPKPRVVRLKLLSLGDGGVGKSCLIKRYCEDRFIPRHLPTIGIDYGVRKISPSAVGLPADATTDIRANFFDTAGDMVYGDVRCEFYKDVQGALIVFDVTSAPSFARLDGFLREATKHGGGAPLKGVVCANKMDLLKTGTSRAVSAEEASKWAASKGFVYFETSAATGSNVREAVECLVSTAYKVGR